MIKLGYYYSELDKQHEFYLDCGGESVYSQWIYFGIGQIITNKKDVHIYSFYPSWRAVKTLKEYTGTSGKNYVWYGNRIGKIILKKLGKEKL